MMINPKSLAWIDLKMLDIDLLFAINYQIYLNPKTECSDEFSYSMHILEASSRISLTSRSPVRGF